MSRNWLFAAVGLGAASALALAAGMQRKRTGAGRELGADLGKWEGEGGNVPQVPTVTPAPTPAASVPHDLRH
jgi:hypothetical protein